MKPALTCRHFCYSVAFRLKGGFKCFFIQGRGAGLLGSLVILLLFFPNSRLSGQEPDHTRSIRFEHLLDKHPLSSEAVTYIYQDKAGFIWIATEDGLNRFDGHTMYPFRHHPEDTGSLSSNWVLTLYEDTRGRLWVGTKNGLNYLDRSKGQTRRFERYYQDSTKVQLGNIYQIHEDKEGNLLLGGDRLHVMDGKTLQFKQFTLPTIPSPIASEIQFIETASDSTFWIGTHFGLYLFDRFAGTFSRILTTRGTGSPLSGTIIRGYHADPAGQIWFIDEHHLLRYSPKSKKLDTILTNLVPSVDHVIERQIAEDRFGQLWIGKTARGLVRIDPQSGIQATYRNYLRDPHSLSPGIGERLVFDKQGNLWIGGTRGLDRLPHIFLNRQPGDPWPRQFIHLQVNEGPNTSANQKMVRSFLQDKQGRFWVGTYDGLYMYDHFNPGRYPSKHFYHKFSDPHSLSNNSVRHLIQDREGNIWVSTRHGLNRINGMTMEIERIRFPASLTGNIDEMEFWSLLEDASGSLWVGTSKHGLLRKEPETGRWQQFRQDSGDSTTLSGDEVTTLFQDSQNRIWVGTLGGGLNLYRPESDAFLSFLPVPADTATLSGDMVWSLHEDAAHRLWIGTQNGLNRLVEHPSSNSRTWTFDRFMEEDGLVNNSVYGILSDKAGRLWLSTLNGLSCYDPKDNSILNFGEADGLGSSIFNPLAQWKDLRDGTLFFGGIDGYYHFHPGAFDQDLYAPPVVISSVTRYAKNEHGGKPQVDPFVAGKKDLYFSYNDNILIFSLFLSNFQKPESNRFQYFLEGWNENWVLLGTENKITFTDPAPGKYKLRIRGENHDGVGTRQETQVGLHIAPPWWNTIGAKFGYILLTIFTVYIIYRYQLNKRLAEREAQQLKDLDQMKTRFYTNISHEFRTPLTIILGMVDKMRAQPDSWTGKGLDLIKQSGSRLLALVNQILDLQKLESGEMQVHWQHGDIIPYLKYITDSFSSWAESKSISLHFLCPLSKLYMDYDEEKMLVIMSNLLSNAVKYSIQGGDVYVQVDREVTASSSWLGLRVIDTGSGITGPELNRIFDRFYKVEDTGGHVPPGTGVGLALTRELVQVLGGSISASSTPGEGANFNVKIPIKAQAQAAQPLTPVIQDNPLVPDSDEKQGELKVAGVVLPKPAIPFTRYRILIVEDNADVRLYIRACMPANYQVIEASDGRQGVDLARKYLPDLIISDVMLPEQDGLILCETLKKEKATSHIPIVLLTAKADMEAKLESLRHGADAYMTKPFDPKELLLRLQQLLALRKSLKDHYSDLQPGDPGKSGDPESPNEAFLQNVAQVVRNNMSKEHFPVAYLCREVGISRTQLHNKIKALTGLSTTAYMRSLRLQRARELLETTDLNVAEVGYEVGIYNPAYFSRIYKAEFGEPPGRTRK